LGYFVLFSLAPSSFLVIIVCLWHVNVILPYFVLLVQAATFLQSFDSSQIIARERVYF
jgi:hypothetical protein